MSTQSKILIITGDAGESYETLYAMHRFQEAGYTTVIASTSVKRLNLVIHEFEPGWDTYKESKGYQIESDIAFDDVITSDYAALILIGGRAPEYLRNNARVIEITRQFSTSGKYIFAICHGIQVLVTAGLVKNKKITCYEHVRFEVESCGGHYISTDEAVQDGKLITGKTWQSHPEFYRLVFNSLNKK